MANPFEVVVNNNERSPGVKEKLKNISESLGFIESATMTALREKIRQEPERLKECYNEYDLLALESIAAVTDQYQVSLMDIGYAAAKVLLYMEAGRQEDALEELIDSRFEEVSFLPEEQYMALKSLVTELGG
jgi:hypothetical protein